MYKLNFHVPESHLDEVKAAVFAAGAGCTERYDSCCWQVMGEGQFRPLAGSSPYQGEIDSLEKVVEYRVGMVCAPESIKAVITALLASHPYEQPAWEVVKLVTEFSA
ncbi:MAG: NGG1p interacting factor NIF3 [Halioglobus sp.]|nr:NGG1p interacting factor NIF3 [Halioglobus sp.]